MRSIRDGEIDTVIVWHVDRLYRRLRDLVELVELAEKNSVKILTVRAGTIDLGSPAGRMMAQMLGAAARYEVEQKGARQVAANVQRANRGEWQFSTRPYGYERAGGEIRIVPEEAAVIREAVGRYVAGESWYGIAADFKKRGILANNGKPFSYQNLRLRMTKPALAGIRTYRGEVASEQGIWEPIIDRETWERLQSSIASRSQTQDWSRAVKYLGTNVYRCGKCGGRIRVVRDYNHGRASHPPVYVCENHDLRRNLAKVDELVESVVVDRLSSPDARRLLTPSEDAAALASESRDIRQRIDGLAELYAEGVLTSVGVRTQREKLNRRLEELQARLSAMQGGSLLGELVGAADVEDFWRHHVSIQNKRRVVAALLDVVLMPTKRGGANAFRPEDVHISWKS